MRSKRVCAVIGLAVSLLFVSSRLPGQGTKQAANPELAGTWDGHRGQSEFKLTLNADRSGSLNGLALQWTYSRENLTLVTAKGTFRYRVSFNSDSLTLSGGDLRHPISFQRVGAGSGAAGLFEKGSSSDTLPIPGNPPVTQKMVDKGTRFFAWLLDAQLTEEQRNQFRDSLVRSWKSGDQDGIQATLNVLNYSDRLEKKSPEERELTRTVLRTKYLELMRQQPNDTLSRWVLAIYDSAHRPIADGNPPLTRQVADAYAEFVSFITTECMGKKAFTADRRFKDALARQLASQYSSYSPKQQRQFAQVPVLWAALRFKWAQASESEREKFRRDSAPAVKTLLSGAPQRNSTEGEEASQSSSGPSAASFKKLEEHYYVNTMCNSSFATTMSLHLNMWH